MSERPGSFAITDMRRAITEARNRPGMSVGLPRVTVDASRLEYVLRLTEAALDLLPALRQLTEAARSALDTMNGVMLAIPGHMVQAIASETAILEYLDAEQTHLAAALSAAEQALNTAEWGAQ